MPEELVVLVDESGHDLLGSKGEPATMGKMTVHRVGLLHRAVSVFVFNNRNELLLQKRADDKYHSPDKWSNTCCTHCPPGETPLATARRRLNEEMGIDATLKETCTLSYRLDVGNGLVESEFNHLFFGFSNQNPKPDPAEVSDWQWMSGEAVRCELTQQPENYSAWFRYCFERLSGQGMLPE